MIMLQWKTYRFQSKGKTKTDDFKFENLRKGFITARLSLLVINYISKNTISAITDDNATKFLKFKPNWG